MEETSSIPNELFESVREAVGRRVKLTLRRKVQLEVKGDKVETRVLALATHRAYLLTARVPSKVELSFSYLDLQGISSSKPTQLVLEHERGPWSLRLGSVEEVDEVIAHIGVYLYRIYPTGSPVKLMKKLSLKPPERLTALQDFWNEQSSTDLGPCGGFSHQYWCVCDGLGLPYREEVQWDVDTIYLTQDTKELNLQDFVHLENRDLVAILAVLEYNQWFTKLSSKDIKLSTDVCDQIFRIVARSSRLEELVLDNAGLRSDFAQKLASALSHNPSCVLQTLILNNNSLEDKGISALSAQLAKLPMGLKHLNVSRTSMSPKGVNSLCQALCANPIIASTLTHLDLSGNSLRGDDIQNLHSFLSHPNHLETLDLSNSDCSLEPVCSSLFRGSLKHLSVLNMSKTVFSHRKCKEIPASFKQFFSSSQALTSVSLSGTRLPLEALKALLLGLGCNPNLSEVSLDLSCCELRSGGSQILEGCIAEIPNISSLDISDNSLDMDLTTLLVWLAKNRSIRHLSLGKNFNNIKSKNVSQVLDNLVYMIQEEESPLTSLSLADSKLKSDLSIVLNALGSNTSLTKLDISGNAMGDMGAKMLAKALQINTKLRTLVWDRNNVSSQGLQDVAAALEKNYTIRFMPVPIMDAAQALKANPEKTEEALLKMEQYLLRNHETRRYLQEQAYRLQQGIVTSTTQQMMDTICVRVQDHLNSLRFSETNSVQEDMKVAENLMKDARNSKTLLPNLYHMKSSSSRGACVEAILEKLESMAGEVTTVMDEQLQTLLVSMVDAAEGLCPHVTKRSGFRQELLKAGAGRMAIPRSFVTNTLLEQSGIDIINKISEVKLSMASSVSDRIVDVILESLSASQNTLADHLIRKGKPLLHQEIHHETEVLDETVLQPENQEEAPKPDRDKKFRLDEMESIMMTPKSKRKSILVRMLRPVSVAFEMEFDLDKALEEVPIHIEDPPLPSPPPPSHTSDRMSYYRDMPPPPTPADGKPECLGELPPLEHKTLESCTKLRPKPKNRMKPSRAPRQSTSSSVPQDAEQNSAMGKLDEGVDDFFTKKVIKLSFRFPSIRSPSTPTPEATDKKRDSRKSGFFNYIKSRASRSEKTLGAPSISPPHPFPAAATTNTPLSTINPVLEVTSPTSPTPPVKTHTAAAETHPELHRAHSSNHTDPETEAPLPALKLVEEEKEERNGEHKDSLEKIDNAEKKEIIEKKETPHMHRPIGIPVMGKDLLAEMKARQNRTKQEKMAEKKSDSSPGPDKVDAEKIKDAHPTPKSDVHPSAKSDVHPSAKSDVHPHVKFDIHPSAKSDVHPSAKSDVHPHVKFDIHPSAKSDVHPSAKSDVHPPAKLDFNPSAKLDVHSPDKSDVHPPVKLDVPPTSKLDGSAKPDVHPVVPVDTDDSKPELIPRSRPPSVTRKPAPPLTSRTSGPLSPLRPRPFSISVPDDSSEAGAGSPSPKAPLPAPRLRRAQSDQDRESTSSGSTGPLSPLDAEFPADGDAFEQPVTETEPGSGSRQWSSLKSSSSPPPAKEEDRERTKSLPAYVRLPSQTEADLSPAEGEIPNLTSDLKSNNKSEDESGDDPPSM